MNRETKEMLEEIKEEKVVVEEMTKNMIEKEKQLNELVEKSMIVEIKNELNRKIETVQNKHNELNNNVNNLKTKQNVIESNYVKKDEFNQSIANYVKRNEFNELSVSYQTNLSWNEMNQLEQWTNKKCSEVLCDSDKDNWSQNTSVFDDKIMNKSNVVFIVEDTQNNKFGYYFTGTVVSNKLSKNNKSNDCFLFSLKSNGRLDKMMKFEESSSCSGFYVGNKSDSYLFYACCDGLDIHKENCKSDSHCRDHCADYHGKIYPLRGTSNDFSPKRITVIQMQ